MKSILSVFAAASVAVGLALVAQADSFTWDTAAGGNWNDLNNWKNTTTSDDPALAYPKTAADTAVIRNTLPSNWPGNLQTVTVNVADINGANLDLRDDNPPAGSRIRFRAAQNATFNLWTWFNDTIGNGRSDISIASGTTLSINRVTMSGRYVDFWLGDNQNTSVQRWDPDGGGQARHDYIFQPLAQTYHNITVDHSAVTDMIMNAVADPQNGKWVEARDTQWIVGNATANQKWTMINGRLVANSRSVGSQWNFDKVGGFDVDMGKRTGGDPSDGMSIERANSGDHGGVVGRRRLFATASGGQSGGTVKIANYQWTENARDFSNNNPDMQWDKIGANLIVTDGGKFELRGRTAALGGGAQDQDVNMVWLLPGNTLTVQGADGDIIVNDNNLNTPGRLGIYFAGSNLVASDDLLVTGPNTFLNAGVAGGSITAGGDVIVQSRNPTGFSTIDNLITESGNTATVAFDDFDLRAASITMNGGGSDVLQWSTDATHKGLVPVLSAGDFSQANFTADTLSIADSSSVLYSAGSVLFLDGNFFVDPGASLSIGGSLTQIHVLDPDLSELARVTGYLSDGRLPNASIVTTAGVGFSIVPEPSAMLLALGALLVSTSRRRSRQEFTCD